jgi:pyrroloquinoline quinone (PQQ) biosynthesis protein C
VAGLIAARFEQAEWLLPEIQHRAEGWAMARHPFSERWSTGALTPAWLQLYAGEYHHAVAALADASGRAAALAEGLLHEELARYRDERERDIGLWCTFAVATGWDPMTGWYYAADPLPETEAGVATWVGDPDRSLAEHLVTIYALETVRADLARPHFDALLGRYGFDDDASTRYFSLCCAERDGPAGLIEAALTGVLPVPDPFRLVRRAELAHRAVWDLLDGVDRCAGGIAV